MINDLAQLPEIIMSVDGELDDIPSPNRGERAKPMRVPDGFQLGIPSFLMLLVVSMLRVDSIRSRDLELADHAGQMMYLAANLVGVWVSLLFILVIGLRTRHIARSRSTSVLYRANGSSCE